MEDQIDEYLSNRGIMQEIDMSLQDKRRGEDYMAFKYMLLRMQLRIAAIDFLRCLLLPRYLLPFFASVTQLDCMKNWHAF